MAILKGNGTLMQAKYPEDNRVCTIECTFLDSLTKSLSKGHVQKKFMNQQKKYCFCNHFMMY